MELQSKESTLSEIQHKEATLGALIRKWETILQKSPSWNITREDPDLEAAAKNHAKTLVEHTIPDSIAGFEQRREGLQAERSSYVQEHGLELVALAREFDAELTQERRTVERLSRELRRGFTTPEVVDRRKANLHALEERRATDLRLQAGFELLSQQEQTEIADDEPIEATPNRLGDAIIQEGVEKASSLPPLYNRLKPSTFRIDNPQPNAVDLVDRQLTIAQSTEEGQLTESQKQLLEDVAFIENMVAASDYGKVFTPEELHRIVTKVNEYIEILPDDNKRVLSPDFERRVISFAAKYKGYSGKVTKNDTDRARLALGKQDDSQTAIPVRRVGDFAETASLYLGKIIHSPNQNFRIKVDAGSLYQAAFDVASYDIYRERNPTVLQMNLEAWESNKAQIADWQVEVKSIVAGLRQTAVIAKMLDTLDTTIAAMYSKNLNEDNTDKVTAGKAISLQLKIGHLVDEVNNKLTFLQTQEARAQIMAEADTSNEISGDAIPSLLPQLDYITSIHEHRYNPDVTVGSKELEALATNQAEQTSDQQQLLDDVAVLSQFTSSEAYKNVYTPTELHGLAGKLQLLSQKNRPDFDEIESGILRTLEDQTARWERPDRLVGAGERANKDSARRRGMQWDTLKNFSREASECIHTKSVGEARSYFVTVRDPQPQVYPNITEVYQVVADMYALDTIGRRNVQVEGARQEAFIANSQIINKWFEDTTHRIGASNNPHVRKFLSELEEMVDSMNGRLKGEERRGPRKDYRLNAAGAIGLQKKIGHTADQLKAYLTTSTLPGIGDDIVPLNDE